MVSSKVLSPPRISKVPPESKSPHNKKFSQVPPEIFDFLVRGLFKEQIFGDFLIVIIKLKAAF